MTPEERLQRLLHDAVDDIDPSPHGLADLRTRIAGADMPVSRLRWPIAAAAAVLFVAAVGLVAADDEDESSRVMTSPSPTTTERPVETTTTTTTSPETPSTTAGTSTTSMTTTTTTVPPTRGEWHSMSSAPGLAKGAPVWTGEELVAWSGRSANGPVRGGVAYRVADDRWREFDHGPLAARQGHSAVWTGREIVYWGGDDGANNAFADGAAFDPSTGAWRRIAAAPLSARMYHEAVWTGEEMVVWGGFELCCPVDSTIHDSAAAAYDPANDSWRRLADVPEPWSGVGGSAVTVVHKGDVLVWRHGRLGRLDMDRNEWRDLGGPKERRSKCSMTGGPLSLGGLVTERFLVWYGECSIEHGTAFDLAAGTWSDLADPPPDMRRVAAAGDRMFALVKESAIIGFDPTAGAWSAPNPAPNRFTSTPTMTWTGSALLAWSGADGNAQTRGGAIFRPSR